MLRCALLLTFTLTIAACSEPAREPAEMDHSAMDHEMMGHEAAGALEPLADDGVMPEIEIRAAWMRPHPNGRDVTAAYFAARLIEGSADRLVSAQIAGAERVELHGHTISADGMMQMHEIGAQTLTGEGPLVFTPGGRHLMVFGLPTVVEGDAVDAVLVFERAGEVAVRFQVRNMPPGQITDY